MKTYDDIAQWYDQWVGGHAVTDDAYYPAVEALLGEVKDQRICDLACGQGRVSRHLASRGAHVVGVDLSANLLAIAQRHEDEHPCGIAYVRADARSLDAEMLGLFDGVVCHMALMDIADLAPTLQGVARILRPGGWFVFSALHPCYHTPESDELETVQGTVRTVRRYFAEGYWRSTTRPGPPGQIGAHHRTLSTYVNTLTDAGLQVVRMSEPRPPRRIASAPSQAGALRAVWQEVPAVVVVRCTRAEPPA